MSGYRAMTVWPRGGIAIGIAVFALALPAVAHHGAAGLFDEARTVEIAGSVKAWAFVNPHPYLILEVADETGRMAEWDVYFGPAGVPAMRRRGYSDDTFAVGETIVVTGHPAVAADVLGIEVWGGASRITRTDGTTIP